MRGVNMKKIFFIFMGLLFTVGLRLYAEEPATMQYSNYTFTIPFGRNYDYTNIKVRRVVDGDTLVLENGDKVRLIGIDTPEMHESDKLDRDSKRSGEDRRTIQELGKRSFLFVKDLIEGKQVSLEFDLERRDRYGRLLAYVFLKDKNQTFVNAEIVKAGYASLMTFPPNIKYADLFLKLYQEARVNKRGLWK
jgi:micrococcal nuclease